MYSENNIYETDSQPKVYNGFPMFIKDKTFTWLVAMLTVPFVVLTLWGGFNSGYTLSTVGFITIFTVYLANKNIKFKLFPYICLILSLFSAVTFTYSSDFAVRFFLFFMMMLSMFVWFSYLGGYDLSDDYTFVSALLKGIFGSAFGSMAKSLGSAFYSENKKKKGTGKIIAGVACAIPAMFIIVLLLRSSDAAFDGLLSKIGSAFGNFGSLLFKINVGLLFFPFILSLGLGLAKNKREQRKWQIDGKMDKAFTISFLSAISLVYVTYLFSQLAYFFNAFKGLLPNGITYASYARRGFFEMSVIAAINFILISLACLLTKKKENGKRSALLNSITVFIGVFTLLLIATALSKMILYIKSFGMTRLRILTSAFMVFLTILFIAVILRVFIKKIHVLKTGVIAATVILLILGFADVDKTVAEYNLYAYEQKYTENLDVEAIGNLGYGAVPTLYEIFEGDQYDTSLRFAAREELYRKAEGIYDINNVNGQTEYSVKKNVGSFNVNEYKAKKILDDFLNIK